MKYKHLDISDETVEDLKSMWEEQRTSFFSWWNNNEDNIAEHPLAALVYCLEAGIYPPPSILLKIAETYEGYIHKQGEISLEDAFFGKPIKGKGNYSSRKAKSYDVTMLHMMVQLETLTVDINQRRSQIEIAEEYLDKKRSDKDPEHLLRALRRLRTNIK